MVMANDRVRGIAVRFTSAPVIEYCAMCAIPPNLDVTPRARPSNLLLSLPVSKIATSSCSFAMASGLAEIPYTEKVSISS